MMTPADSLDDLDARIIAVFTAQPRVGVLECSRQLRVARGTVQARLDRMARDGVIRGWGPELDPEAMGYAVTAFATLEIRQGHPAGPGHDSVAAHLASIPEVLEAHTITGAGDVIARIVARSNADLQRVIDRLVDFEGVVRTSTVIALATQIPYRVMPLVQASVHPTEGRDRVKRVNIGPRPSDP
ncbi:MAG: hypothetical protein QOJ90_2186 [Actinomycetota bacterium]|jgi:DNA-binding Lrp family transcriptional regulator|nr:hypothetical protein [Actinomycetota bacterium]MDQ1642835.1 hypothetical protein [Actinomycetota bacterium]